MMSRCVNFDRFASMSHKFSSHRAVFLVVLFGGKSPQMMNYPVIHHLGVMLNHCS